MAVVSGIVKDSSGNFAARMVRAYRRSDGALAGQTVSNTTTGAYSITTLDSSPHLVVAHDGEVTEGDPYFNNVGILMHFDGNITDEKMHTASFSGGGISVDSTDSMFGSGSLNIVSGSSCLAVPESSDWELGTGDFTIEFFAKVRSFATSSLAGALNIGLYTNLLVRMRGTRIELFLGGSSQNFNVNVPVGEWHHVAFTRQAGTVYGFYGGVPIGTWANTFYIQGLNLVIGMSAHSPSEFFDGHIDELRITKGIARYSTNFTPPISAFIGGITFGTPTENALIFDNISPL